MIEDKELRDLFKIESAEHISRLENGFLRLEKEPENHALLEEVFREAHSLKGAARMLNLTGIEDLAHGIEEILGAAAKGRTALTSETIDALCKELDAVKGLASEALSGEKAGADVRVEEEKSATRISQPDVESFMIETVRVDTKRLDALMTQVGELSVTKGRIAQRLTETEDLIEGWEKLKANAKHSARSSQPPALGVSHAEFERLLNRLQKSLHDDSSRLEFITDELEESIYKTRLLPLSTIFGLFTRTVRDLARERAKEAELSIEGGDTTADKRILEEMKDPLMHLIRNAIDHGIETAEERERAGKPRTGSIVLRAYRTASNIVIEVKDDGKGLDIETIKNTALKRKFCTKEELSVMTPAQTHALIFVSGFSTSPFVTEVSGRGVGLDVVRANVEGLKGTVHIESTPGHGCAFRVQLPVTLATVRALIVAVDGIKCAVPVAQVQTSCFVTKEELFTIEGRETIIFGGKPVSVSRLSDLLEIRQSLVISGQQSAISCQLNPKSEINKFPCIILAVGDESLGIIIDELLDEQEVVLKPQGRILRRVRNVSGSTILGTGEICTVLNPLDMIKSVRRRETPMPAERPQEEVERKKVVLLAEDSITTRTQERRILTGAGYEVVEAVDGMDALNKLGSRQFDAVVSDILMPNMDGLTLTRKIREDKRYRELPVILVTSLAADDDRKKGLEAGANAYIVKPAFDQQMLLETIRRLA